MLSTILMRNLEPIIDDRHLDSGSANAERVQDVHIQIDAWPRTLVAEHRLALDAIGSGTTGRWHCVCSASS